MPPIGVIGNVSLDVVDGGRPRVGGTVFYAAAALRLVGAAARVATQCAARDRELLLPPLIALGFPVEWRAAQSTARFELRYLDGHRKVVVQQPGPQWSPADIAGWSARAFRTATWVHVGGLLRGDFATETLAALARRHRLVVDAQGLVRRRAIGRVELTDGPGEADVRAVLSL